MTSLLVILAFVVGLFIQRLHTRRMLGRALPLVILANAIFAAQRGFGYGDVELFALLKRYMLEVLRPPEPSPREVAARDKAFAGTVEQDDDARMLYWLSGP